MDDSDAGKRDKSSVDYSRSKGADKCGACTYFLVDSGRPGRCRRVKGQIDPDYWCLLFEKRK